MTAPRVFLSHTSTMARLPEGRSFAQAALDALAEAELLPRDMRYFAADDRTPAQLCVDAVRGCDVYVGILGLDYGSPVRDRPDVSYTQLEFEAALERKESHGMRVFAFLLDDKAADESWGPLEPRQEEFRQRVLDSGLTAAFFATPGDLQHLVYRTLHQPTSRPDRPLQHRDRRALNFLDREGDLRDLTAVVVAAARDGTSLSFVGLKGMGGIGKTALAAELAERLAGEFPGGVLWVNLQEESPAEAARRWLRDLRHEERDLGPEDCLRRFRQLAGDIRPLIVLDNVPRPGDGGNLAEPLLVKAPGVATLLTTRFREAVPAGVRVQPLDVLPPDEARALLQSHIGQDANDDPAAAEVVELCERLPLFVNVAGAAVARGYFSLAGYAEELRGRGLAALAEEDESGRSAAVFGPSWEHLSDRAKEVFAVLALAPGEDVGPNLVRAWLEQAAAGEGGRPQPGRVLAELANASLLTPVAGRASRYRYHDRVRDYALTKLPLPEAETRRRLLSCWTSWDMVKAEFEAVGADGLATQYLRLRAWGVDEPADFAPWFHFARGQASVLGLYPELFFQQAFNEPTDSPVSRSALERVGTAEEPGRWLEWENRPREWVPPACLMALRGHTELVTSVGVTPDGRVAVSGSYDGTVRVWDLAVGRSSAILEGHTDWVRCVAVATDGRTAVSGSHDRTVRVWDLDSDRCSAVLEGHTGLVTSVAVTGDGRTAVSGSFDGEVRVWDLAVGRSSAVLEGHTDWVRCVAVATDGRMAVSGSEDWTVRVWDLAVGRCSAVLEGHTGLVTSVAVTGDGRTAVSGSEDGTVRVWDLEGGRCSAVLEGHPDWVFRVALAADGGRAVSGSHDRTVRVWDLAGGRCTAELEGHTGWVTSVAVTGDGRTAVSGSHDRTVRVWDLGGGRCTTVLEGHTDWVRSVAVATDGRTAVSRSDDGTVRVWDLAGGRCTAVLRGHTGWVGCVVVTGDGRTAVSGSDDGTVRVWDLAGGGCTAVLEGHTDWVRSVAVTGDGRTAVSGSHDRTVRVWDLAGGRCSAVLEGHTGRVRGVAVTADGGTVVSGSDDKTVRVWDLSGGRCTAVLEGHTDWVRSVAVTGDGRTAVSGSDDGTVRVWDLAGGRCTASHTAGSKNAKSAWAAVNSGLASTADIEPYGLTLRDPTGGAILARFPGSFTASACSADGRHVVAGDGRGGVYLLRLHTRRS
jgi:WD40 repeat protein